MRAIVIMLSIMMLFSGCESSNMEENHYNENASLLEEMSENSTFRDYIDKSHEDVTETEDNQENVTPIVFHRKGKDYCTLIGGIINQQFINIDEYEKNVSYSEIIGKHCSFFINNAIEKMEVTDVMTYHVDATGTNETEFEFDTYAFEKVKNISCFGLINSGEEPIYTEVTAVNKAGTYAVDIDFDGESENIVILNSNGIITISLKNQESIKTIKEFELDEIYTTGFEVFSIDINQDGMKELIICLNGHNYSTEVYDVSATDIRKVLGYYMGN